jgi:hypothetical protein
MITKHTFNREMSIKMAQKHRKLLEHKGCYNNVFKMIAEYHTEFRCGGWKIAYGYLQAIEGIYVRHCFIVDDLGRAIDPTIVHIGRTKDHHDHISFKMLDVDTYLDILWKNDRLPALDRVFRKEEQEMWEYALKNNIMICG